MTEDEAAPAPAGLRPMAAPAVILVEPQLGENIGMVARAMLTCGLTDLRLVAPRDGWPNEKAVAAASGADPVIGGAGVFATVSEAVADLSLLMATTARPRDMTKRIATPRVAVADLAARQRVGTPTGILFGKEARGLHNDVVALADRVIHIPTNPDFSSLNLAMAVQVIGYEWLQATGAGEGDAEVSLAMPKETRPASKAELIGLFEHLERELDVCGFLRITHQRPTMVRNLRNALGRAELTEQEVRTLRGVIACLVEGPRKRG